MKLQVAICGRGNCCPSARSVGEECGAKAGQGGDHRVGSKTGHRGDHRVRACPSESIGSTASSCEPLRDEIELGLSRGRNAIAIWQDLVATHSFAGNYQSVKRYVRKLRGSQTPQTRVVIQTAPGEEAQVDYGTGPMVRDPLSGEVSAHTALRDDAGLQPEVSTLAGLSLQHAHLGRVA